MEISDVVQIEISEGMITEAEKDATFLAQKIGQMTRPVIRDRDIIGSLAHQAAEAAFEQFNVPYTSTRTEQYKRGDACDIIYEHDYINVKGTHGFFDKWFFNKEFLVFQQQLDDPKTEALTHFLFVLLNRNTMMAYVFGLIRVSEFLRISYPVTLQYQNRGVKAYRLQPFNSYIYRV